MDGGCAVWTRLQAERSGGQLGTGGFSKLLHRKIKVADNLTAHFRNFMEKNFYTPGFQQTPRRPLTPHSSEPRPHCLPALIYHPGPFPNLNQASSILNTPPQPSPPGQDSARTQSASPCQKASLVVFSRSPRSTFQRSTRVQTHPLLLNNLL